MDAAVDSLQAEARVFTMASHLMWALWSFPMACSAVPSHFGYVEYGLVRLKEYLRLKSEFLASTHG
jgi:hypothetical protein